MPSTDVIARLPHAPPFLFVTGLDGLVPGERGSGTWRLDGQEAFLAGHFPGRPVVPGVLVAEALAQLAGLVAFSGPEREDGAPVAATLARVNVRFDRTVAPPCTLHLDARQVRVLGALYDFEVEASVDSGAGAPARVARGEITLAAGAEDGAA